jgi:hypothetical protein
LGENRSTVATTGLKRLGIVSPPKRSQEETERQAGWEALLFPVNAVAVPHKLSTQPTLYYIIGLASNRKNQYLV